MKLISLKIKWFKNLDFWDNPIDFTKSEWISIFVWNNWSWKSNVLEAISAIFYGLYDETNERRCAFSYELEYEINWKNIKIIQEYTKWWISIWLEWNPFWHMMWDETEIRMVWYYVDSKFTKKFDKNLLPSQIIALYSWEETRLYENYYLPVYDSYIKNIITSKSWIWDHVNMTYINKDFWNIALLTMTVSDISMEKIFWELKIDKIVFDFNDKNLKDFNKKNPNQVTRFALWISEIEDLDLEKFKEMPLIQTHKDLYKILSVATFPKEESYKLVNSIDLFFDNWVNTNWLSEWQKKQILIYFVTQILAEKDSIILLDEPDSYIHVWNKQRLKEFFDDFLNITKEWEFIMTTHSPTLMNKFDKKHLFYLENGKLDLKEKREILDKITDWQMSLNEMEVFLNSWNKYLLVTEWITDKKHLEIAIEKLWIKNNYDIYSADSCEKLTNFLITLPNDIFANKTIIWIYDYDQAWLPALKRLWEKIEENKKYKVSWKINRFWISLPYIDVNFENNPVFTIEFMYSKEILKTHKMIEYRTVDDINRCIKNQNDKLNLSEIKSKDELYFYKVSESDTSKNSFTDKVRELENSEFINFKVLFDLIDSF